MKKIFISIGLLIGFISAGFAGELLPNNFSDATNLLDADSVDIAIANVYTAASACELSDQSSITLKVKNFGSVDVESFNVKCFVNNVETNSFMYNENVLAVGDSLYVTFLDKFDFSEDGATFDLKLVVEAENDVNASNDSAYTVLNNLEAYDVAANDYVENFEVEPQGFSWQKVDEGAISGWFFAHGEDVGHNDTAAFTNMNFGSANDYLFTSCFSFDTAHSYDLSFFYRCYSSTEKLKVLLVSAPNKDDIVKEIIDLGEIKNTTYEEANASFTVEENGVYYLAFFNYQETGSFLLNLDDITISATPIIATERIEPDDLTVYPIPAQNNIHVVGVRDSRIEIFNVFGENVYSSVVASDDEIINIASLAAGDYVVRITEKNIVKTRKIVIIK